MSIKKVVPLLPFPLVGNLVGPTHSVGELIHEVYMEADIPAESEHQWSTMALGMGQKRAAVRPNLRLKGGGSNIDQIRCFVVVPFYVAETTGRLQSLK